jgi:hypothetical protein
MATEVVLIDGVWVLQPVQEQNVALTQLSQKSYNFDDMSPVPNSTIEFPNFKISPSGSYS